MRKSFKILLVMILMTGLGSSVFSMTDSQKSFLQRNASALSSIYSGPCISGGLGTEECSIGAGIEILGYGTSFQCSVKCRDGFYACCGLGCHCIDESGNGSGTGNTNPKP